MHTIFPNKTISAIVVFLIFLNIISWSLYVSRGKEVDQMRSSFANMEQSKNILAFQRLFIDNVLQSDGVVDYDARRRLEQSVGSTNDKAVIDAWNAFLEAKTEIDAQEKVKKLLSVMTEEVLARLNQD